MDELSLSALCLLRLTSNKFQEAYLIERLFLEKICIASHKTFEYSQCIKNILQGDFNSHQLNISICCLLIIYMSIAQTQNGNIKK